MKLGKRLAIGILGALLSGGLGVIGAVASNWLGVLVATVPKFGWSAMRQVPLEAPELPIIRVPDIPDWVMSKSLGHVFLAVIGFVGFIGGGLAGTWVWRYLVVTRLGWMTSEEATKMLERDPGW
jgi:hypothetical protein